jgi:hypothetical protein
MVIDDEEENNDFNIRIKLEMDHELIISFNIIVKFSGGDISPRLSCKFKFELVDDFNYRISEKSTEHHNEDKEI